MRDRPPSCGTALILYSTQQLGLALLHPCARRGTLALRAMPIAAAVVGNDRVLAVLTARNVAAEGRRAAALDRAHDLQCAEAHVAGVGATPSGPVVAEDIRDLQSGPRHEGRAIMPAAPASVTSAAAADRAGW
jgi:hypothetical protein